MSNAIARLEGELTRALNAIQELKECGEAVNFPALQVLFNAKSENQYLEVAVLDGTDYFFRGRISDIYPAGRTFDVLTDSHGLIYGMTADRIISVRLADRK